MTAKFHTFLFTPDLGRSDILMALANKVAGNCHLLDEDDSYDEDVIVDVDVKLGFWATDEEWSSILTSWKLYCDETGLPTGYFE